MDRKIIDNNENIRISKLNKNYKAITNEKYNPIYTDVSIYKRERSYERREQSWIRQPFYKKRREKIESIWEN